MAVPGKTQWQEPILTTFFDFHAEAAAFVKLNEQGTVFISASKWALGSPTTESLHAIPVRDGTGELNSVPWSQYGQDGRNSNRLISLTAPDLKEALDVKEDFFWRSGGGAEWTGEAAEAHYDSDALAVSDLPSGKKAWVEMVVNGGGTLGFRWRLAALNSQDRVELSVFGEGQRSINGGTDWQEVSFELPEGSHRIRWTYTRGERSQQKVGKAWLDKLEWQPSSQARLVWRHKLRMAIAEPLALGLDGKIFGLTGRPENHHGSTLLH